MKPYTRPTAMTEVEFAKAVQIRPKFILSSNSKLSKDGIWNLTMPALRASIVQNGKLVEFNTCPSAGACKAYCYASSGTYLFKNSMVKHTRNLQYLLDDPFSFVEQVNIEIRNKVNNVKHFRAIRFNDSGDIFSDMYYHAIEHICNSNPNVQFYCYTKRVSYMKSKVLPSNLTVVFSMGGKEDHLINMETDRHAKVFPSRKALREAGYSDGTHTDRLACNPKFLKIGIVVHGNHLAMPKFRKMIRKINK